MGKIRVSALGDQAEQELKEKQKVRREEKKKREESHKVHVPGMKGGERVKSMEMDETETNRMAKLAEEVEKDQTEGAKAETKKDKKEKFKKVRVRGKNYQSASTKVERNRLYPISEALALLREVSLTKFDSTVELHINTLEKGQRGTVQLPHGTGKEVRVRIADPSTIEKLLADIEAGALNFDALVAHPSVMPKLARAAKVLGPRGLMPNPKAGTISTEPEKVAEKLKGGEVNWKSESEFPIIHQVIGKMSFKNNQLEENLQAFIKSVGVIKIKNVTIKSTMSPGIKIQL